MRRAEILDRQHSVFGEEWVLGGGGGVAGRGWSAVCLEHSIVLELGRDALEEVAKSVSDDDTVAAFAVNAATRRRMQVTHGQSTAVGPNSNRRSV